MSTFSPRQKPGQDQVTFFAATDFRNQRIPFGIKADDRTRHIYVIGKTGMGKSTLLENMAIQDIQNGNGMAFFDPHGKTAELLLKYIPKDRIKDVLYFAPFDTDFPMSFNIMEDVGYDKRHLVVSGLMSAFKKIWVDSWSARMEYILSNTLLALLEYPDSTLLSVNRMYTDKDYRKKVVENITDPSVRSFWVEEYAKYTDRYTQEATPAIQNKVGQFTSNPLIRNIVGQPKSTFDLRKMMDERKIMIVNLSKGRIGEGNANLLGSMLITKLYLAAMSRADLPEAQVKKLPNFYLYVDEFQSFANESFANILSEARKYNLNLTLAHQYIEQMPEEVRAAVFGNVGTMIMFRVGAYDAEVLEKEYSPVFTAEDMVNLGFTQIYLKLMIDGVTSHPFSAVTLPPIEPLRTTYEKDVMDASRKTFAQPRTDIENAINEWYKPLEGSSNGEEERSEPRQRRPRRQPNAEYENRPPRRQERPREDPFAEAREKFATQPKEPPVPKEVVEETSPSPTPRASLDDLKKKSDKKGKDKDKGPSAEHLADLRAALASAMKKEDEGTHKKDEKPPQSEPESSKEPLSTKEIPRNVLEDILNVEKP